MLRCRDEQLAVGEQAVWAQRRPAPGYAFLQPVTGLGPLPALTILLEAGDLRRFPTVGPFASSCRCVGSQHLRNGQRKGAGNPTHGNK